MSSLARFTRYACHFFRRDLDFVVEDKKPTMMRSRVLAPLFPALVHGAARILLFSFTLIPAGLLRAAALPGQSYHLPSAFEQNRGQAPKAVKWLAEGASYRLLFDDEGVTFLLPDKG